MAEKKPLKIGTLNVKNIDTNIAYTRELLDSYDILVIQEHWLFSFQLLNLENIFPHISPIVRQLMKMTHSPPVKNQEDMVG